MKAIKKENTMKALLCLDFIEEIIGKEGKLASKGYRAFAEKHGTLKKVRALQEHFRSLALPVIHVKVGFEAGYPSHPTHSPLFGKAQEFGVLQLETPATNFVAEVSPEEDETVIVKHRVSAFFNTELNDVLKKMNITQLYVAGVATNLAVEAAVRDAHDRDYRVTVVEDACAAADETSHKNSILTLTDLAKIITVADIY